MKKRIFICLFPLIFSGQDINPQSPVLNNSKKKEMNERLSNNNDKRFSELLDSINKENESLVKEINRKTDIINKNKGYIKNNERKIVNQESKITYTVIAKKKKPLIKSDQTIENSVPEVTIVYIPIENCIERRTFLGRFFHDQDCKLFAVTDSIKIEIQNY